MSRTEPSASPKRVKIHIRGHLDEDWVSWFEGMQLETTDEGITILQGEVPDQSAVYGILARLRDLGLELLYVEQSE